MRVWVLALLFATFLLAATLGYAASGDPRPASEVTEGYAPDRQTVAWRTAQSPADSTSIATLTSTTAGQFIVNGKPTISVGARFTAAGQTCKVRLLYEYSSLISKVDAAATPLNMSNALTITGSSYTDAAGKFVGPPVVFDSLGATHVYAVIDTGSAAGQFDLWVGSN